MYMEIYMYLHICISNIWIYLYLDRCILNIYIYICTHTFFLRQILSHLGWWLCSPGDGWVCSPPTLGLQTWATGPGLPLLSYLRLPKLIPILLMQIISSSTDVEKSRLLRREGDKGFLHFSFPSFLIYMRGNMYTQNRITEWCH